MKPIAVDLCCGLGGWTEGLLAEGWDVVGFDIERHVYGEHHYPAQLVLQDIRTLDGRQFRGKVGLIVASPPCTEFSYMAMPWSRGKQIKDALNGKGQFPEGYTGSRTIAKLTELFDVCVRIGREAECPTIIENVRGAQPWVGRSAWAFGSYHLWGDVPALMPITLRAQKFNPDGTGHPPGSWFAIADSQVRGSKVSGFSFDGSGRPFQSAAAEGTKGVPHKPTGHWTNPAENGVKFSQSGEAWLDGTPRDHMLGAKGPAAYGSKSNARKVASAMIAKIPFALARHIARAFKPEGLK